MNTDALLYPFDPTGKASTNLVQGERQVITPPGMLDFYFIIPKAGPYFRNSLKVTHYPSGNVLIDGVDFTCSHSFQAATHSIGLGIYGSITFYDHTLTGTVSLEYQTVGGDWTIDEAKIAEILANTLLDPRITTWEQVVDVPYQFPPIAHEYSIDDWYGAGEIVDKLADIAAAIGASSGNALQNHIDNKNNPHQVTATQVGLGLVGNYPMATIGEAQAGTSNTLYMSPLRSKNLIDFYAVPLINAHANRIDNPHATTKAQVGLGNVDNNATASTSEAQQGASNARFMTPLRTKEAIAYQVGDAFAAFVARRDNPHQVTQGQVGLGNVQNFGLATQAQAEDGSSNTAYMTPTLTKQAIAAQVGNSLTSHINNTSNPHGVTKSQVGLGLVQNLGLALQADAEDGLRNDVYMTPLMTRYAIAKMADASVGAHAQDYNNPHHTTAEQVGAYDKATVNQMMAGKLDSGATAVNATNVYGMDLSTLSATILGGTAANAVLHDNLTVAQVVAQAQAGTSANSLKLEGKTLQEVIDAASSGSTSKTALQNVLPDVSDDMPGGVAYTNFAYVRTADLVLQAGNNRLDVAFIVAGGALLDTTVGCSQLGYARLVTDLSGNYDAVNSTFACVTQYGAGGPELWATVGTVPGGTDQAILFWTKDLPNRQKVTITDLCGGMNMIPVEAIHDVGDYVGALDTTKKQFTSGGAFTSEAQTATVLTGMADAFNAAAADLATLA